MIDYSQPEPNLSNPDLRMALYRAFTDAEGRGLGHWWPTWVPAAGREHEAASLIDSRREYHARIIGAAREAMANAERALADLDRRQAELLDIDADEVE